MALSFAWWRIALLFAEDNYTRVPVGPVRVLPLPTRTLYLHVPFPVCLSVSLSSSLPGSVHVRFSVKPSTSESCRAVFTTGAGRARTHETRGRGGASGAEEGTLLAWASHALMVCGIIYKRTSIERDTGNYPNAIARVQRPPRARIRIHIRLRCDLVSPPSPLTPWSSISLPPGRRHDRCPSPAE